MAQTEQKRIFGDVFDRTRASRQAAEVWRRPDGLAEHSKQPEQPGVATTLTFMINTGTRHYIEVEAFAAQGLRFAQRRARALHHASRIKMMFLGVQIQPR